MDDISKREREIVIDNNKFNISKADLDWKSWSINLLKKSIESWNYVFHKNFTNS